MKYGRYGKIVKLFLILIILILFFCPAIFSYDYSTRATQVLMDAKNVQLAMRLTFIQYYGNGRNLYEPNTEYGMKDDTINEIKKLSGVEGEITLISWNVEKGIPNKFFLYTDSFLVIYSFDETIDEPKWEIYRVNKLKNID